jgi:hypothetical protein
MLFVAGELSKAFTMIRVDLYSDGKTIFVGELTNVNGNAEESFIPKVGESEASSILFG